MARNIRKYFEFQKNILQAKYTTFVRPYVFKRTIQFPFFNIIFSWCWIMTDERLDPVIEKKVESRFPYTFFNMPLMKTQKGTKKSANSYKTHFFHASLQINVESDSGGTESNVHLIFCRSFTSWSIFVCINLYRYFFGCILNFHCQIHVFLSIRKVVLNCPLSCKWKSGTQPSL